MGDGLRQVSKTLGWSIIANEGLCRRAKKGEAKTKLDFDSVKSLPDSAFTQHCADHSGLRQKIATRPDWCLTPNYARSGSRASGMQLGCFSSALILASMKTLENKHDCHFDIKACHGAMSQAGEILGKASTTTGHYGTLTVATTIASDRDSGENPSLH